MSEETVARAAVAREFLETCSPIEREVIRLREKGKKQREIADAVGRHQTTVGRIIKRVRGRFREFDSRK